MGRRSFQLLIFYFITAFGSTLSSIATFLSIDHYFGGLIYLGLALALKTLASSIFSYATVPIINRWGEKSSFVLSQVLGLCALVLLTIGFTKLNLTLAIIGVMAAGLPATFVAILVTIFIKNHADGDHTFRQLSGKRELVVNGAMLCGAFLAPVLLLKISLIDIFVIDGVSFLIGILLICRMSFTKAGEVVANKELPTLNKKDVRSKPLLSFVLKTSAALLLTGLLPLLAGAKDLSLSAQLPVIVKQWLWVVEDVMIICSSIIYLRFVAKRDNAFLDYILVLSGVWLLVAVLAVGVSPYLIYVVIAPIPLLFGLAFQKYRDDLVIAAGENKQLVKHYSALTQVQRNFVMFVSPILLSLLFMGFSSLVVAAIIIALQIVIMIALVTMKCVKG